MAFSGTKNSNLKDRGDVLYDFELLYIPAAYLNMSNTPSSIYFSRVKTKFGASENYSITKKRIQSQCLSQ